MFEEAIGGMRRIERARATRTVAEAFSIQRQNQKSNCAWELIRKKEAIMNSLTPISRGSRSWPSEHTAWNPGLNAPASLARGPATWGK